MTFIAAGHTSTPLLLVVERRHPIFTAGGSLFLSLIHSFIHFSFFHRSNCRDKLIASPCLDANTLHLIAMTQAALRNDASGRGPRRASLSFRMRYADI